MNKEPQVEEEQLQHYDQYKNKTQIYKIKFINNRRKLKKKMSNVNNQKQ